MKCPLFLKYIVWSLLVLTVISCQSKNEERIDYRKNFKINLFPKSSESEESAYFTYDQAFEKSNYVAISSRIVLVDSSLGERGNNIFYIYSMQEGTFLKTPNARHSRPSLKDFDSFSFVADHKLFEDQAKSDSLYIFLRKLDNKSLINQALKLSVEWLPRAPEIAKNRK